mmetsp:Transcript_14052/g.21889  ORF Transcript_14052/g.21889 Transcript_14052/m.21889 type:complete len:219 (-) Transcript_14052:759-1415(-)
MMINMNEFIEQDLGFTLAFFFKHGYEPKQIVEEVLTFEKVSTFELESTTNLLKVLIEGYVQGQEILFGQLWNRSCEIASSGIFPSKVRSLFYLLLEYDSSYPMAVEQTVQFLDFYLGILINQIRSRSRGKYLNISIVANMMSKLRQFEEVLQERGVMGDFNSEEFYQTCNTSIMQLVGHIQPKEILFVLQTLNDQPELQKQLIQRVLKLMKSQKFDIR